MVKKALIIGCTFKGSKKLNTLSTDNDALSIDNLLKDHNYTRRRLIEGVYKYPSRENILEGIDWLVNGASRNDSLFIYFAGHAGINNGDNRIWTADNKVIWNWELRSLLVDKLPSGCDLNAFFQGCKTGNILGLKYNYVDQRSVKNERPTIDRHASSCRANVACFTSSVDQSSHSHRFGSWVTEAFIDAVLLIESDFEPVTYYSVYKEMLTNDDVIKHNQLPDLCTSFTIDTSTNVDL